MKSEKLGFYTNNGPTKISQTLNIGDVFKLGTLFGYADFTVKSIDRDSAHLENNPKLAADLKLQNGWWTFNHINYNPQALIRIKYSE